MLEALLRTWPLVRILIQHPGHEVQSLTAAIVQQFAEVGMLVEDRVHQLAHVVALERLHSGQHHVEHDAGGPHVDLLVVDGRHVGSEYLGRRERSSARLGAHLKFLLAGLALSTYIEVKDVYLLALLVHDEVLRLDITMAHADVMQVADAFHDLAEEILRHLLGIMSMRLLRQMIEHLHSVNILHNHLQFTLGRILKRLDSLHDVLVLEAFHDGSLLLQRN